MGKNFAFDEPTDGPALNGIGDVKELYRMWCGACDEDIDARLRTTLSENIICQRVDGQDLVRRFRDCTIPSLSRPITQYIDYLVNEVVPYSINMLSPRCMGHMTTALPTFVRMIAQVVTLLNQNLVKRQASGAFTLLERQTVAMLHRLLFRLPDAFYTEHVQNESSTLGLMSSGGTVANLTALWLARNGCLGPTDDFAGIEIEGVPASLTHYGWERAVIVGSHLMHYSIDKAAGILGLGERGVIKIPTDHRGRLDMAALGRCIEECGARRWRIVAIVGVAGTTDYGSIDPLAALADQARAASVHFHVDAAWGAPLLFSRRHAGRLAGIEQADSVTIDGHKQLYLPIGTSMVLLRDPMAADVIGKRAGYMLQENSGDQGRWSVEGSRPATALFVHAALNTIGSSGYECFVDSNLAKVKVMAERIRARVEFELLAEPETNIILYRFIPPAWRDQWVSRTLAASDQEAIGRVNSLLQKTQFEVGRTLVSQTTLKNTSYGHGLPIVSLRAVVSNPHTTINDMEAVLSDQVRIAAKL
jgi:putative pyridoxal-dependent aspartate 1-decarboxylase